MTVPRPRPAVAGLPAYIPGRPPAPGAFKLSSNECPYPPIEEVMEAVARTAETLNRYPDMGAVAMYGAIAEHLGVRPDRLAAGTGSTAVIYNLVSAFCEPGDKVIYPWRSFEAYPIAVAAPGAVGVQIGVLDDGRLNLDEMVAAIDERTRIVMLCTPNNPSGPALTHSEVVDFVDSVPADVLVVLDEAYREFVRMTDQVDSVALVSERDNVVSVRSFAKAYAMAGLRVGYLIGHPEIAAALRAISLPFGVSGFAQAGVIESFKHRATLMARVDEVVAERVRVLAALREQGWQIPDSQGNFVWFAVGERTAELAELAEEHRITVRAYPGDGVRVSLGLPEANDITVKVAAEFLAR